MSTALKKMPHPVPPDQTNPQKSTTGYYNVCLEKGSDEIRSAACYTIYTIYLSFCTQTADPISSEPFFGSNIIFREQVRDLRKQKAKFLEF